MDEVELNFENILREFSRCGLDYILVGGVAVNLHGIPRMTYDLDILLEMKDENLEKFVSLMEKWGYKPKVPVNIRDFANEEKREDWIKNKNMKAFNLFNPEAIIKEIDVVIDFPFDFEIAKENVDYISLGNISIPVLNKKKLIEMKKNTGRKQDEIDIRYLEELLKNEKGF